MKNLPFKKNRLSGWLILISLSLFLMLPWWITAEEAETENKTQPIEITADQLITDNEAHTAEFSGNVTAVQGGTEITAERLILHYRGQSHGKESRATSDIEKIEAIGKVRMTFDNRVAVSEQAVYTTKDRKLVFRGPSSKISEGQDEITGGEIIFDRNTKKVTIGKGGHENQVKAIIRSNQRGLN